MAQETEQDRKYHFDETQRLTTWLPWAVMFGVLALILTILFYQLLTGNEFGSKPASNVALIGIIFLVFLPSLLVMRHAKLIVRIDNNSIYYGWNIPTDELNKISFSNIESCDIINYKTAGYGYTVTKKYGIVYSASGDKGLQIISKSGEKILLSTHKIDELADVLTKLDVRHNL